MSDYNIKTGDIFVGGCGIWHCSCMEYKVVRITPKYIYVKYKPEGRDVWEEEKARRKKVYFRGGRDSGQPIVYYYKDKLSPDCGVQRFERVSDQLKERF
jgi:hypothetical protein